MSAAKDKPNPFAATVTSRAARTPAAPAAGAAQEPTEKKPRPAKAPAAKPARKPRGHSARRTDPVRMTIDLAPPEYTSMRHVLLDVAAAADHPTLTAAAMWRAMLAEMREDPRLITRVASRIAADKEDR